MYVACIFDNSASPQVLGSTASFPVPCLKAMSLFFWEDQKHKDT